MAAWLGIVSAEHVARGVSLGIAQINHGGRAGLARMRAGDWLVYYSPQQRLGGHQPVKAFTAIGQLPDGEIWQADEGCFKPCRRRVDYRAGAGQVPIDALRGRLELTASPNWGYQLRRGLISLCDSDFGLIHEAMTGSALLPASAAPQTSVGGAATLW